MAGAKVLARYSFARHGIQELKQPRQDREEMHGGIHVSHNYDRITATVIKKSGYYITHLTYESSYRTEFWDGFVNEFVDFAGQRIYDKPFYIQRERHWTLQLWWIDKLIEQCQRYHCWEDEYGKSTFTIEMVSKRELPAITAIRKVEQK